jgi:hypothetical protein
MQYLQDEGYHASQSVLYDETNVKWKEREERTLELKRLKKFILGKRERTPSFGKLIKLKKKTLN